MAPCAAAVRACSGAADTEEEAHARADALVHAGVVLRFNGIVYLKPQEVSELVYRVSDHTSSNCSTARIYTQQQQSQPPRKQLVLQNASRLGQLINSMQAWSSSHS
jgi:hypothetical protein